MLRSGSQLYMAQQLFLLTNLAAERNATTRLLPQLVHYMHRKVQST
jgi:hypothetical protein